MGLSTKFYTKVISIRLKRCNRPVSSTSCKLRNPKMWSELVKIIKPYFNVNTVLKSNSMLKRAKISTYSPFKAYRVLKMHLILVWNREILLEILHLTAEIQPEKTSLHFKNWIKACMFIHPRMRHRLINCMELKRVELVGMDLVVGVTDCPRVCRGTLNLRLKPGFRRRIKRSNSLPSMKYLERSKVLKICRQSTLKSYLSLQTRWSRRTVVVQARQHRDPGPWLLEFQGPRAVAVLAEEGKTLAWSCLSLTDSWHPDQIKAINWIHSWDKDSEQPLVRFSQPESQRNTVELE